MDLLKIAFLNEVFHYFRSMCQKNTAFKLAFIGTNYKP